MRILGINSVYHESSASLIVDGQVCCAVEEERFNRVKHGAAARVDNPHELPLASIRYCLQQGDLVASDLDAICYSFEPELRRRHWQLDPYAQPDDWGHPRGESTFYNSLMDVQGALSELLQFDVAPRFHWVPHHLAHAASTYFPSAFASANILVVDGIGEDATALLAIGNGAEIEALTSISFPNSVGFLWEKFSKFLGFSEYDAAKVMGLAGYGNPAVYRQEFEQIVAYGGSESFVESFTVNNDIVQFRQPDFSGLESLFGAIDRSVGPGKLQKGPDIAATLQEFTNTIMLGLAKQLYARRPSESLCLAGGVALNCQTNTVVKEQGPYRNIYIPSAPHDGGTAVGAALYLHHSRNGARLNGHARRRTTHSVMPHPYCGPSYSDEAITRCLEGQDRAFRKSTDVTLEAATWIANGRIVAWFQGGMEFGPRALGNRSLLADPRDPGVRDVLNRKVKHRETFRPFAPSVLEEECGHWFEMGRFSESYRFMLFACAVHAHRLGEIPAVIHIDNTARIQTVNKEINPKYHQLISHFHHLTGVPMVLNTSFNDSEPIVCTPQDALNTFNKTGIDVLVLGDYIVERGSAGRKVLQSASCLHDAREAA